MITGYNTDVEHDGVVYHVQTEDKGLRTPFILSLVYTGGEILASKRSPYDDLIAGGFDQKVLIERLERQHKLICAAVHAGRIEDLKRMGERPTGSLATPSDQQAPPTSQLISPETAPEAASIESAAERFSVDEQADEGLSIDILDEKPMRSGESVTLRIEVTKPSAGRPVPAGKANVTVKVLGSSFQPSSTYSTTDSAGRSSISLTLPAFKTGRAAILIRAEADGEVAEVRRVIDPS